MKKLLYILLLGIFSTNCSNPEEGAEAPLSRQLPAPQGPYTEFTILQMNDVYEIAPSRYDNLGGLARVAALQRKLIKENPYTLTVLCGDFLSPSVIGLLKDENGEPYAGKQMVEVLNAVGVKYVTFGNHEFDLSYEQLKKRIDESAFTWTSCNVFHKIPEGATYFTQNRGGKEENFPQWVIHKQPGPQGINTMGILGMTLPFNQKDYVNYSQVYLATKSSMERMLDKTQFFVAMSHLEMESDREMARRLPQLRLIMGGHDHQSTYEKVGGTVIAKADANAKSVWVHRMKYYAQMDTLVINSEKVVMDSTMPEDPGVKQIVDKWLAIEEAALKKMKYQPYRKLTELDRQLDAREISVRSETTIIGQIVGAAYMEYFDKVDCAILNGGSIRYDDYLVESISEKDVLGMLPFGGAIVAMKLKGKELQKTLDLGLYKNIGTGGFLQTANIFKNDEGRWLIGRKVLDYDKTYTVAMPKFLADGKEANLEYLGQNKYTEPDSFEDGSIRNDSRDVVIAYLGKRGASFMQP